MSLFELLFSKTKNILKLESIDKFTCGFPNELKGDVSKAISVIPKETYYLSARISADSIHYKLNGAMIMFPYRIYFTDVPIKILNRLSERQKMIIHCIYSRSKNGFARQENLKALLSMEYYDWAIPYIVKACDEYIVEILEMTYDLLKTQDTQRFKRFCLENAESFQRSHNQMISYWNLFYRDRDPKYRKYVGRKLFRECFGYTRALEKKRANKKT